MSKEKPPYYNKNRYVPFISDYGFKVTFGDKDNSTFARKALEIILEEEQPILELRHLRNEFQGKSFEARSGLYDVICQDEYKRVFIIEMQVDNYENLMERLQFYAFQLFNSLVRKGEEGFQRIAPIHCICIMKGSITESTSYHQVITLKNEENEVVMGNIVFHFIELGKFAIPKNKPELASTAKEKLFYTMKYTHTFDPNDDEKKPPFWEEGFYKIALNRLDLSRMSPLDIALYENSLLRDHVVQNRINKEVAIGIAAGLEKAMQDVEKVAEKAKQDAAQAKQQVAKKLKDKNIPIDIIAETTGLSIQEIENL